MILSIYRLKNILRAIRLIKIQMPVLNQSFKNPTLRWFFQHYWGEKKKAALRTTLSQMANKLNRAFVVTAGPDKALSLARKAVFDDIFKPPLLEKWQVMGSSVLLMTLLNYLNCSFFKDCNNRSYYSRCHYHTTQSSRKSFSANRFSNDFKK